MQRRGTEEGTHCMRCGHFYQGHHCIRCAVAEYPENNPPKEAPEEGAQRLAEFQASQQRQADEAAAVLADLSPAMSRAFNLLRRGFALRSAVGNSWHVADFHSGKRIGRINWMTLKALRDRRIAYTVGTGIATLQRRYKELAA